MSKFYGGGAEQSVATCAGGWKPSRETHSRPETQAGPASTYTPEEARMAEQYARDAMADAAPDLTGERRAYQ